LRTTNRGAHWPAMASAPCRQSGLLAV